MAAPGMVNGQGYLDLTDWIKDVEEAKGDLQSEEADLRPSVDQEVEGEGGKQGSKSRRRRRPRRGGRRRSCESDHPTCPSACPSPTSSKTLPTPSRIPLSSPIPVVPLLSQILPSLAFQHPV
ncbi:hypothetical protein PGT21_023582 [Puccinia graminis f. sp. tritici]|uniref:Uncharacterized protein n=1 Tax=Puccinia graminis f. sp. tritici TaxID=56615 RepID=A0A5B0NGD5_PUCGR|nr:hypothetical protein PGT21_023582 [Puccinia graminis f. sp. tritici]